METIVAKKSEFKHLTEGKSYEGTKDGEFYILTNDKGVTSRYHKRHFVIKGDIKDNGGMGRADEVKPKEVKKNPYDALLDPRNVSDEVLISLLTSLQCSSLVREGSIYFTFNGINYPLTITPEGVHNSCGIQFVNGLNSLMEYTTIVSETLYNKTSKTERPLFDIKRRVFEYFLRTLLEKIAEIRNFAFVMFTTTDMDLSNRGIYFDILSEQSNANTGWEVNPNSNNNIKIWILSRP